MVRQAGSLLLVALCACTTTEPGSQGAVHNVVAADAHELWITDRGANQVLALSTIGELERVVLDEEHLDRPSSVRMGADGWLYVASFGQAAVLRFDLTAGTHERFYDDATLEEPVELLFRGDELCVLGNDTRNAIVLSAEGALLDELHPVAKDAHDFAFGPDGLLYIASGAQPNDEHVIHVWDVDGHALVASLARSDEITNATSVAFAPDGSLFVADYPSGELSRYDVVSGERLATIDDAELSHPVSIDFGPDGLLYVMDDHGVSRFVADTGERVDSIISSDELVQPRSFTFVPR